MNEGGEGEGVLVEVIGGETTRARPHVVGFVVGIGVRGGNAAKSKENGEENQECGEPERKFTKHG